MSVYPVNFLLAIARLLLAIAMTVSLVGCGVDITSVGQPTDSVMEKARLSSSIEYGTR